MNFNPSLDLIESYQAGRPIEEVVRDFGIAPSAIIKLASNENPRGCSPLVREAIKKNLSKISLYPDDSMLELKELLAKKHQVTLENIIIGSGSDQIIEFCVRAKINKDSKVLIARTTFAMYEIYAKQMGCEIIKTKSFAHSIEDFKREYQKHHPDLIFLCLPNNPLGECLDSKEVYEFLSQVDKNTMVVLDGAYQEYAEFKNQSKSITAQIIKNFDNVVYLRTFSKVYGLGGMRLGYGIADKSIIDYLSKVRPPFNVSNLSLIAGVEALKDGDFIQESLKDNLVEMKKYEDFAQSNHIDFLPSWTNFITFFCEKKRYTSSQLTQILLQNGLIVRDLNSYGLNAIRITIGTAEQNIRVFSLLKEKIS